MNFVQLYRFSQKSGYLAQILQIQQTYIVPLRFKWKKHLDYSKYPKINEDDLEEQYVRGSGPGGQATNKTNNCVVLKHKPTGLIIKCHHTRSLSDNQKKAREILLEKLDQMINGEDSIANQELRISLKKQAEKKRKQRKREEMKVAMKERLAMEKEWQNSSTEKND